MQRVVEPELMNERAQAEAYAHADFEEPHRRIVESFDTHFPGVELEGCILDLGCGPGDITFRWAARFPRTTLVGLDGSAEMIRLANERRAREKDPGERIRFTVGIIPGAPIPAGPFCAVVSNSLLHHLHEPLHLWQTVASCATPGTKVFISDLRRPESEAVARIIVDDHAAGEPEVLRRDFYNSLRAAFTPREVEEQLARAGLPELAVTEIGDRHLLVFGVKR